MSGPGSKPLSIAARKRRPLLSSCAIAALGVIAPTAGQAQLISQVYNGTVTGTGFDQPNADTGGTIRITSPNAVLNWTPTDTATRAGGAPDTIDFQTKGAVTTFVGPSGGYSTYTVLNRVVPTDASRSITFNGTTQSYLSDGRTPGGNIWFYSPGGIVAGPTARFDVGSLLLSTGAITAPAETGYGTSPLSIGIDNAANSRALIDIQAGAQLNALATGSYVALVAPRINQAGTINTGAGAALVAAEDATLTIAQGLFSIQVTSGSAVDPTIPGDDVTLTHTGSTGNQQSRAAGPQAVYLMAVPKNQAVTMLVAGTLGYTPAAEAAVRDGVVVLTANGNLNSDADGNVAINSIPAPGLSANVAIASGLFTSRTEVAAIGNATATTDAATATGSGILTFQQGVRLQAGGTASLTATAGKQLTVNGDATVLSLGQSPFGVPTPGTASLTAEAGSTLTITGSASLSAGTNGNALAADVRGGAATAQFTDATVQIGSLLVDASATGASGTLGGTGTGGTAKIIIEGGGESGGSFQTSILQATAYGYGGSGQPDSEVGSATGGRGIGGTASIAISGLTPIGNDDSTNTLGTVTADAGGIGGYGLADGTTIRAAGFGGGSAANPGGGASLTTAARNGSAGGLNAQQIDVRANGHDYRGGGEGGFLGDSTGGIASLTSGSGLIQAETINVNADGIGGDGPFGFNAPGFGASIGQGGRASVTASGGSVAATSTLTVTASGVGGVGGSSVEFGEGEGEGSVGSGGVGGIGTGGSATLTATGSSVTAQAIDVLAFGSGGRGGYADQSGLSSASSAGGAGGAGQGGAAAVTMTGPAVNIQATGGLRIDGGGTGGRGGDGLNNANGSAGGSGTGGTATLTASAGTVGGETIQIAAAGLGGDGSGATGSGVGGVGGAGRGGQAQLTLVATSLSTPSLSVSGTGTGGSGGIYNELGYGASGSGGGGAAGAGFGTLAAVDATSSTLAAGSLSVSASGQGGVAGAYTPGEGGTTGAGGAGADGTGGTASVTLRNTTSAGGGGAAIEANGIGTNGGTGAATVLTTGGNATSGTASLGVTNGSFDHLTQIRAVARAGSGVGGSGGNAASTGTASITGTDATLSLGQLTLDGSATGGAGGVLGRGGSAVAGGAALSSTRGTLGFTNAFLADGRGTGAAGTTGAGDGTGGIASVLIDGSTLHTSSNQYTLAADGIGADAQNGNAGNGRGGTASATFANIALAPVLGLTANGTGGNTNSGTGLAGNGQGGGATLIAASGASVTLDATTISATGIGRPALAGGTAGSGTGGGVSMQANGGTISAPGALITLDASGTGGAAVANALAGNGSGGATSVTVAPSGTIDGSITAGQLTLRSGGIGGAISNAGSLGLDGGTAGAGTGGGAAVNVQAGTLRVTGVTLIDAAGTGGALFVSGTGGAGTGGTVSLLSGSTGAATIDLAALTIDGRGTGGSINESGYGIPSGGGGGAGQGATATFSLGAGSFSADALTVNLVGQGGAGGRSAGASAGGNGGDGRGGAFNFAQFETTADATTFAVDARGLGGAAGASASGTGGNGGAGIGGGGTLATSGASATLAVTSLSLLASGTGAAGGASASGAAGPAGSGTGGTARLIAARGSSVTSGGAIVLDAGGTGSASQAAQAGAGRGGIAELAANGGTILGGSARVIATAIGGASGNGPGGDAGAPAPAPVSAALLTADGGTLAISGTIVADASATGGAGSGGGVGGSAYAGMIGLRVANGGTFTSGNTALDLLANAQGGTSDTGAAGAAFGGRSFLTTDAATLTLPGTTQVSALGTGGNSIAGGGGSGGAGSGGTISVDVRGGGTINYRTLILSATGTGGTGSAGGGAGLGGTSQIVAEGSALQQGSLLTLTAAGRGGDAGVAGNGGAGVGGTTQVSVTASAARGGVLAANALEMVSDGTGGSVLANLASEGALVPAAGSGTGGTSTIDIAGSTVTIDDVTSLSANGQGGRVDRDGIGGAGTGGTTAIRVGTGAFPTIASLSGIIMSADGLGGGGIEAGYGGLAGADGGDGRGGTVALQTLAGATIDTAGFTLSAVGTGANAVNPGDGRVGRRGGSGTGGTIDLRMVGTPVSGSGLTTRLAVPGTGGAGSLNGGSGGAGSGGTIGLRASGTTLLTYIDARGAGGVGMAGTSINEAAAGTAGGSGGAAKGGSVTIAAEGDGGVAGNLTLNTVTPIDVSAVGGSGARGANGSNGGAGGAGGSATGGSISIAANSGSVLNLGPFIGSTSLDATARAGAAGPGGDGSLGDASVGLGGDGGNAQGGTIDIASRGGTLTFANAIIAVDADATYGSAPGRNTSGGFGPPGAAGTGTGGTATISVSDGPKDGTIGRAAFGNTTVSASGTRSPARSIGGQISIADSSSAPESALTFQGLSATIQGAAGPAAFDLRADGNRIGVTNALTVNSDGGIRVAAGGNGGVDAGTTQLTAIGIIGVEHAGRAAAADTIHSRNLTVNAGLLQAGIGTVLRGDATIDLYAASGVSAGTLLGGDSISVRTPGDITLANAIATTPATAAGGFEANGGSVLLQAGLVETGYGVGGGSFVPATLTITGEVRATARVQAQSGGDVVLGNGARLLSDNRTLIDAGDDILLGTGSEVRAAIAPVAQPDDGVMEPDTIGQLVLTAGRIVPRVADNTNIAAIIGGGTISAGDRRAILAAQAIVADAAPIVARSLTVEVDNAPAPGAFQSNDGGQLTRGGCLAGDVCLGPILASRVVTIGAATGTALLPTHVTIGGDITSRALTIRALGDVMLGAATGPVSTISGSDSLLVQSTAGAVRLLGGATLSGGSADGPFRVLAAGDLIGGTLSAGGDAGLGIGGNIAIDTLRAGGGLNTLAGDGTVRTANQLSPGGSVAIANTFAVGRGDANLTAPGNISVGTAEVANGRNVNFVSIGGTTSLTRSGAAAIGTPAAIFLRGTSVTTGTLTGTQAIGLTATVSDVTATTLTAPTIDLAAPGTIRIDAATAAAALNLNGGPIIARSLTAGRATLASTGDINVTGISGGDIDANARGSLTVGTTQATGTANYIAATVGLGSLRAAVANLASGSTLTADLLAANTINATAPIRITIGEASAGAIRLESGTVALGSGTATGDVTLVSSAPGGPITTGTITSGGTIALTSAGGLTTGDLTAANGAVTLTASGSVAGGALRAGRDLSVTSTGGSVGLASATAGMLNVPADATNRRSVAIRGAGDVIVGPVAAAGDILLASTANVTSGQVDAGGNIAVLAGSGATFGAMTAGGLLYVANTSLLPALGTPFDVARLATVQPVATGGSVTATGAINAGQIVIASGGPFAFTTIDSAGSVQTIGAATGQRITAADIALSGAGGDIGIGQLASAGAIRIDTARALRVTSVNAGGALNVAAGAAVETGTLTGAGVTIRGGSIAATSVASRGALTVTSTGGNIAIDQASATGDATLTANGGTLAIKTDLAVGGTAAASGTAVSLNARGPLALGAVTASTGGIGIEAVGALSVGNARAPGTIRLASSGGSVTVQDASTLLVSGQAVTPDPVDATGRGDILVNAAADARLNGTVAARGDVIVTAGNQIGIAGQTTGANVAMASADVAIGSAAVIGGGAATTSVSFTNNRAGSRTFLGDAAAGDGYRLDNGEFGRVQAQAIRIVAPGSGTVGAAPDVTIGNLAVGGSATAASPGGRIANLFGPAASLSVSTPGTLRIAGNLVVGSAGVEDRLVLTAGPRLDMIVSDATLAMNDAGGAPAGRLTLAADRIVIATDRAAADVAAASTLDARSDRLGVNDGAAAPDGMIRAGGIDFRVGNALFVQNSGLPNSRRPDDRAGLTIGGGGITITSTGTTPIQVAINGRQVAAGTGTGLTGQALIRQVTLTGVQGSASVDPRSTVNGCAIASVSCTLALATSQPPVPPVQDVIGQIDLVSVLAGATDDGTGAVQAFNLPIIQMINLDPFGFAPTIDDPVTGAGNDDLWTDDCISVGGADSCPQAAAPTPTR